MGQSPSTAHRALHVFGGYSRGAYRRGSVLRIVVLASGHVLVSMAGWTRLYPAATPNGPQ
jgi:hypothetical protein